MTERPRLFLCLPLYSSMVHVRVAMRFFRAHSRAVEVHPMTSQSSLLARGFNLQWVAAQREQYDYFLMLHGDVEPKPVDWVDMMLEEMHHHNADVLSAVVQIKDMSGRTSTAIGNPKTPWTRERLTTKQIRELPRTFTASDLDRPNWPLLVNTGCMLVNLRNAWTRHAYFTIRDHVVDGEVHCEPEDWYFSRRAWELGARVYATTAVPVVHHGEHAYESTEAVCTTR